MEEEPRAKNQEPRCEINNQERGYKRFSGWLFDV